MSVQMSIEAPKIKAELRRLYDAWAVVWKDLEGFTQTVRGFSSKKSARRWAKAKGFKIVNPK
jgi:hypothetical protein